MKLFASIFSVPLCLLMLTNCHKKDPAPVDQLPPITQTGANTFGCLLNGQAWTPKGNNGTANYSIVYDPSYDGGSFNLKTYRIEKQNDDTDISQYLTLAMDSLSKTGTYSLDSPNGPGGAIGYFLVFRSGTQVICDYTHENEIGRKGSLTITRLDLSKGIISGTFAPWPNPVATPSKSPTAASISNSKPQVKLVVQN